MNQELFDLNMEQSQDLLRFMDSLWFKIQNVEPVMMLPFYHTFLGLRRAPPPITKDKATQTEKKNVLWSYFG